MGPIVEITNDRDLWLGDTRKLLARARYDLRTMGVL